MSIVIVVSLLSIWFYFGWFILGSARVEDNVIRGLLAPAVGMAVVTLVTTTASLAGMPIKQSVWITVLMLGGISVFCRTRNLERIKGCGEPALIYPCAQFVHRWYWLDCIW